MLGNDYEIIYKKGCKNVVADSLSHQFEDENTLLSISLPFQIGLKKPTSNVFHIPLSPNSLITREKILIPQWATLGRMIFFATRIE